MPIRCLPQSFHHWPPILFETERGREFKRYGGIETEGNREPDRQTETRTLAYTQLRTREKRDVKQ